MTKKLTFHELVEEEFGVEVDYIKSILKQLEEGRVGDITLTEQFNAGFIQGLTEGANQIEKYFSENMSKPIDDFREIDPSALVEDIVVTDKVTDGS